MSLDIYSSDDWMSLAWTGDMELSKTTRHILKKWVRLWIPDVGGYIVFLVKYKSLIPLIEKIMTHDKTGEIMALNIALSLGWSLNEQWKVMIDEF